MKNNIYLLNDLKSKPLVFLFVTLTLLLTTMSSAQSMNFNYINNTNASYNLEDVRKITFDADVMNLHLWDGSVYAWNVSTIVNFQYEEASLDLDEWINSANAWEVKVYPNPTNSSIYVKFNLTKKDEIKIILNDLQGKIILEKDFGKQISGTHQQSLDMTEISEGTYVLHLIGQRSSVTKKVIKQ